MDKKIKAVLAKEIGAVKGTKELLKLDKPRDKKLEAYEKLKKKKR